MSKEAIQYELRDAIAMYGPDCIVIMGHDDFNSLLRRLDLTIYQRGVFVAQGEAEYLGVRVLTNGQPGTSGFIIGSKEDMESWMGETPA
jgi:hypothetical protein